MYAALAEHPDATALKIMREIKQIDESNRKDIYLQKMI
jgi:hypothetical protein